jgi:hypothetical protein
MSSRNDDAPKKRIMVSTIGLAMLALVGWSYGRLSESRDAATAAGEDLAACRAAVVRIEALRRRPAVAATRALGDVELSRRINDAAGVAELPDGAIVRIVPDRPQRIGDTNYQEAPTQVRLQKVTLQQLFAFLHAVTVQPSEADVGGASGNLQIRTITLSAPRDDELSDRWTVDATLSNMVFSPKESTQAAGAAQRSPG